MMQYNETGFLPVFFVPCRNEKISMINLFFKLNFRLDKLIVMLYYIDMLY